jgi:hypothetical protein
LSQCCLYSCCFELSFIGDLTGGFVVAVLKRVFSWSSWLSYFNDGLTLQTEFHDWMKTSFQFVSEWLWIYFCPVKIYTLGF